MNTILKKNILAMAIGFSLVTVFCQSAIAQPPPVGGERGGEQRGSQQNNQAEPDVASILNRMDTDGDGVVSLEDFVSRGIERTEKHFDRLDSDSDGFVSEEEYTTTRGRESDTDIDRDILKQCIEETTGLTLNVRPSREDAFISADTDNDGFLSSDEFIIDYTVHVTEKFSELDSNGDAVISEEEVSAKIAERQLIDAAKKDCIDEQLLLDDSNTNI
jgi:Ca2+-binding EF-hand superfamily protein